MLKVVLSVRAEDVENKVLPFYGIPKSAPFKIYMCMPIKYQLGQVVGECICDKVNGFISRNVALAYDGVEDISSSIDGEMCLCRIRDVKMYDEPIKLDNFIKTSDGRPICATPRLGDHIYVLGIKGE